MYAKNNEVPKQFDFPYQTQQRVSGVLVKGKNPNEHTLTKDAVREIEEVAKHLLQKKTDNS